MLSNTEYVPGQTSARLSPYGIGVTNGLSLWYSRRGDMELHQTELTKFPGNAGLLCDLAHAWNLSHVWVLPGSDLSAMLAVDNQLLAFGTGYDIRVQERADGAPMFASVKRAAGTWEETRLVYIGLAEHDPRWCEDGADGWALADVEQPFLLLKSLMAVRYFLGVDLAWSPGHTGIQLMKILVPREYQGQAGDAFGLPQWAEQDMIWKRPLLASEERGLQYLHIFDRNSQYLAAATGAELGIGPAEHIPAGAAVNTWQKGLRGVWEITATLPPSWFLPRPGELDYSNLPRLAHEGRQWASSDTIGMLLDYGYTVDIHQGHVWKTSRRALQPWAKHLWETRQKLAGIYGKQSPQYRLIKMIATRSLGWLDLGAVRAEKRQEVWHKPHWHNAVKSLAKWRMWLKIRQFAGQGYYPVLCYVDAIGYISPEKDAAAAVPGILARQDELGGFKHVLTLPVSPDVARLFEESVPAHETLSALKQFAKEF